MKIKQVRNATLIVEYGDVRFLVDPFLADKGTYPGFPGSPNSELSNPLVDLKTSSDELRSVDAVIVTHTHIDHWDEAASNLLPKALPVFAQHEADAELIRSQGFSDVRVLGADSEFKGVSLIKTAGSHGGEAVMAVLKEALGEVCGIVFRQDGGKSLYVAGDTVWNDEVADNLATYAPDVIVLNAGFAQATGLGPIIMGTKDVKKVHEAAPGAVLIASHMEAVNHCILKRDELRSFAQVNGFADSLRVPEDDQSYTF
ncbi:hypothetical protein ASE95_15735 [Sphingomonas sp. Leaf231]|uniref:MBL fold metallo-hydrolase n=1 Tax=Sphingomonas sp. Leaf231 TaxID=1736301 RepID=UPI0007021363|nr:MBL fold metallo-hydrolase [Sphingomonas sp. Leaf231]KQN90140.1 hypothetical protein ASE95_15735 [Sphingomonas sp. Leaf231]